MYLLKLVPQNIFFSSNIEGNFDLLFDIYAERIAELKEVEISKVNLNPENCWHFEAISPEGNICSCYGDTLYNTFCYGVLMTAIVDWDRYTINFNGIDYVLNAKNIEVFKDLLIHHSLFPTIPRFILTYQNTEYKDYDKLVNYGFVQEQVYSKAEFEETCTAEEKALSSLIKKNSDESRYFISFKLTELGLEFSKVLDKEGKNW